MTTLYLAGPMTGIRQFNFPAFVVAKRQLQAVGVTVVSPVDSDDPAVQEAAWRSHTGDPADLPPGVGSDPVATAVKNVEDIGRCDGLALLPDWQLSKGTRMEIAVAHRFGIEVAPVALWLAAFS